jgi:hypothetical protein
MDTPDARTLANRRNALKSTGPRTPEGKARSSLNALKHGLTAKNVVLPGEDAEAFEERRQEWHEHFRPQGPAQAVTVERAVQATWKLDRCSRAEAARIERNVRHAAERAEHEARDQAEALGARLLDDPIDRACTFDTRDDRTREGLDRRWRENPSVLVRALKASAEGVEWLLARWAELERSLVTFGHWHPADKFKAVRLLGRRPEDVFDDPNVTMIFADCNAAHPQSWDIYSELYQATSGVPNRPFDENRVNVVRAMIAPDRRVAHARLRAVITLETASLRSLKADVLDDRAALDRASAEEASLFDGSQDGVLLRRYETECSRELRRSVESLEGKKGSKPRNEAVLEVQVAEEDVEIVTPHASLSPPHGARATGEGERASEVLPARVITGSDRPCPAERGEGGVGGEFEGRCQTEPSPDALLTLDTPAPSPRHRPHPAHDPAVHGPIPGVHG